MRFSRWTPAPPLALNWAPKPLSSAQTRMARLPNGQLELTIKHDIIWCPKRRRKVLLDRVKTRLEELIRETAPLLECEILALEILPDHLHLFVSATPQWAPNQIIARLKGKSSRVLREEFPSLRRMPSLWTRSYFISTAGNVSSDTICRYIEAQSTRD